MINATCTQVTDILQGTEDDDEFYYSLEDTCKNLTEDIQWQNALLNRYAGLD